MASAAQVHGRGVIRFLEYGQPSCRTGSMVRELGTSDQARTRLFLDEIGLVFMVWMGPTLPKSEQEGPGHISSSAFRRVCTLRSDCRRPEEERQGR